MLMTIINIIGCQTQTPRITKFIVFLMSILGLCAAPAPKSPEGVLRDAARMIREAQGLSASFSLDYGSQKVSGTLQADGAKFALLSSSSSTWYDGKYMWTYNPKSKETTLITPTAAEVAEANPLSIVTGYASTFTAAYAKTQVKGSKTIVLTPKSKTSGYKSVHVTIPDASGFPSKIVVIPSSGQKMTVSISQVKTGKSVPASTFVYPKSKYPNVEIVDLR